MSKPYSNLRRTMSRERQEKNRIKANLLKQELALRELRQALELTQEQLANNLNMNQAAISKFESQSDIYISTLRKILAAMGAELKIIAHFPEGDVVINQFDDIRKEAL